ncbi:MAG: SusD/RagB family nutrient-binding outer membrane lipoprotein, partial [Leeuwenhoekiella sp.]
MIFVTGCDKDDFAELNSNPSSLSDPDLRFSVTKVIEQMYSDDYTVWFYNNFDYVYPWCQVATGSAGGGNSEAFVEMGPVGGQNIYGSLIPNTKDIRARIDAMTPEEQEARRAMRAMTFPIQIQPAITV